MQQHKYKYVMVCKGMNTVELVFCGTQILCLRPWPALSKSARAAAAILESGAMLCLCWLTDFLQSC